MTKTVASRWSVGNIHPGDYIATRVVNHSGDRNLDGMTISGIVQDVVPEYRMVRLTSGWCCHEKDRLIEHRPGGQPPGAEKGGP